MASQGTVESAFGVDHAELLRELAGVLQALAAGDAERATRLYGPFSHHLRHHMRAEETTLFPAFENHTTLRDEGPTVTIRLSHRHIESRLREIAKALVAKLDLAVLTKLLRQLEALITEQASKEEQILFPACDVLLYPLEVRVALAALGRPWHGVGAKQSTYS